MQASPFAQDVHKSLRVSGKTGCDSTKFMISFHGRWYTKLLLHAISKEMLKFPNAMHFLCYALLHSEWCICLRGSEYDDNWKLNKWMLLDFNVFAIVLIQMSELTQEKCMEIINLYEPTTEARENGQLLIDGNCIPLYSCMFLIQILHDTSHWTKIQLNDLKEQTIWSV